ncbi:MAG: hypothetical protein K2I03_12120 [Lachnospiraceae bacterium]|nr:hypothetical protein [Lachnospiraceae bacterium]MDE6253627.1 hypothetical protein [Lachnospiraceae bacterium]
MTAQVGDQFIYKGDNYSIVAISNPIQFNPLDYGIKPVACCSACWNGYWCHYHISTKGIMLQNLYINSEDDYYPEINNVIPEKEDKKSFMYMGHHIYRNINIFMEYTGKILIGKGFINKYYIHMGYQRAWAYEVLEELIFDKGKLIKTVDHSEMAKKLRLELENKADEIQKTSDNIQLFVDESFSLEMKDKAWWIE